MGNRKLGCSECNCKAISRVAIVGSQLSLSSTLGIGDTFLQSNGYKVSMVDMYAAVDNAHHLADGVHLNQQGTDIMADVFRDEIIRIILGGDANVCDVEQCVG